MKKSVFNSIRKGAMVVAAAFLCAAFGTESLAQVPVGDYSGGIDKNIEKIMKDLDAIGLGVAVVANGKIIYKNSWGYKNLETKTPLAEDDIFRIASISKSFTATSIMQLAERGLIDLNADVSDLVGFKVRNPKYHQA